MRRFTSWALLFVFGSAVALLDAQAQPATVVSELTVTSEAAGALRDWDNRVNGLLRTGNLARRTVRTDTILPDRIHERLDQYVSGVRVFGGELARQTRAGLTESLFGTLYDGISVATTPVLSEDEARTRFATLSGEPLPTDSPVELVILPKDDGGFVLTWRTHLSTAEGWMHTFLDANVGNVVLQYDDRQTQVAVGTGTGVLGDQKKVSARAFGGRFVADDQIRPPVLTTLDANGDPVLAIRWQTGRLIPTMSDIASDGNNVWTDRANVDAHAHLGWTYDYYYRRFGRRGLDDANAPIRAITHPVSRADFDTLYRYVPRYFDNAGWYAEGGPYHQGVMIFGEGLPPEVTPGITVDYLAGGLDVVAHELTHGLTQHSSQLIYRNESGALNESFSDIIGTSVEFFCQPIGNALMHADYLIGEDIWRPGGIRSMANPAAFGDPDHYSRRSRSSDDAGGVHTNSGIPNHAFYLAIEGGTNRTSGLRVTGVGAANREQIEKAFYRAFAHMLTSRATFHMARLATIQSAREQYGNDSAAVRAVTEAWTAVGVN